MNLNRKVLKKGASGAIVEVVDDKIVCKYSSSNNNKLSQQFHWLSRFSHLKYVPSVHDLNKKSDIISYKMEFFAEHKTLLEYVSTTDIETIWQIIVCVIQSLERDIHKRTGIVSEEDFNLFLKQKLLMKINFCKTSELTSLDLYSSDIILINGKDYRNINKIIDSVLDSENLLRIHLGRSNCHIHGDLTAENILVNNNDFILIDPNEGNIISNYCVEISKLLQSFNSDYEYLAAANLVVSDNEINFSYKKEPKNKLIAERIYNLVEEVGNYSRLELVFHEAIHFCRLLPYQLHYNNKSFPVYYAKAIILLNEVVDLIEEVES